MTQTIRSLADRFVSIKKIRSEISKTDGKIRTRFYLLLTISISFTTYWGFTYNYYVPVYNRGPAKKSSCRVLRSDFRTFRY